jgi:23S rRNA (pseudouridine1915-N3)-methyltransferase
VGLGPLKLSEVPEGRAGSREARQTSEAERVLAAVGTAGHVIVLDSRGVAHDSETFAYHVRQQRDRGTGSLAIVIGGPDGHGRAVLDRANLTLSLGPMTLPHGLARVVIAEQLYRAATILAGHPYHRS